MRPALVFCIGAGKGSDGVEGLEPPKLSLILGAPLGVGVPGWAEGERPLRLKDWPEPPPIFSVMVGLPDIVAVAVAVVRSKLVVEM